jgi:hypothetical protein
LVAGDVGGCDPGSSAGAASRSYRSGARVRRITAAIASAGSEWMSNGYQFTATLEGGLRDGGDGAS